MEDLDAGSDGRDDAATWKPDRMTGEGAASDDAAGVVAGVVGRPAGEATFVRLLVNTLLSGVTSTFVWFALVFWAYLETRSVVVTGVIGAAFSLAMAFCSRTGNCNSYRPNIDSASNTKTSAKLPSTQAFCK